MTRSGKGKRLLPQHWQQDYDEVVHSTHTQTRVHTLNSHTNARAHSQLTHKRACTHTCTTMTKMVFFPLRHARACCVIVHEGAELHMHVIHICIHIMFVCVCVCVCV